MFWRKRVIAIAEEYPDVELTHMYVDNAAMQLVRNPKQVILFYGSKRVYGWFDPIHFLSDGLNLFVKKKSQFHKWYVLFVENNRSCYYGFEGEMTILPFD